ncbi:hypothetical protein QZH41_011209 [Actinostola sp. cb2023]|nr:hypothetical protein QZH41_011209 [Actinostola sp. cb2023]
MRINGTFNPRARAGWQHIDDYRVKTDHFALLLRKLGPASLDRVRDVRHTKQTMYLDNTRVYSYKCHELTLIQGIFNEGMVALKTKVGFKHGQEVALVQEGNADDAILAAKRRAGNRYITAATTSSSDITSPTSISELVVSKRGKIYPRSGVHLVA